MTTAVVTEETADDGGETCWKYTCMKNGLCREDKCTSAGNDCWANLDPAIEPMTCARYVTCAGTLLVAGTAALTCMPKNSGTNKLTFGCAAGITWLEELELDLRGDGSSTGAARKDGWSNTSAAKILRRRPTLWNPLSVMQAKR